jgi:hypothetical protein
MTYKLKHQEGYFLDKIFDDEHSAWDYVQSHLLCSKCQSESHDRFEDDYTGGVFHPQDTECGSKWEIIEEK